MKNILMIFLILFINSTFAISQSTIKQADGNSLFSFPESINYIDSKMKTPKNLVKNFESKPVLVTQTFADELFKKDNDYIEITNFPVNPEEFKEIKLSRSTSAVNKGTRWIRNNKAGEIMEKSIEPQFYTGYIKGEENSKVNIFYNNGYMYCIIERDGFDNYSITPVSGEASKDAHILSSQASSLLGSNYNPFLEISPYDEADESYGTLVEKLKNKILSTDLLRADIIIEATSDFYRLFNDYDKISNYIAAVMSHSSQIYERDIYVMIFVSMVVIQEEVSTDPYSGTTQLYDRLKLVRNNWRNKSVKRTLVVLMTDIDYQGGSGYRVGGISWGIGTLCNNNNAYCIFGMQGHYKYPTSNYTWDVSVASHEMGHAFGAYHTHHCVWKIDTCITQNLPQEGSDGCQYGTPIPRPGTIMSYCHLTNSTQSVGLYFHELQKPVLRDFAENVSCIKKAVDPTLVLLSPYGGNVLVPGDTIPIRWASMFIEFIAIKYSIDNGQNWIWIEPYAVADSGQFYWIVPQVTSNQVLIHIQDSYNAEIFDKTESPLSIDYPFIEVLNPLDEDRIGQKQKLSIKWNYKYLESVDIDFTSQASLIESANPGIWENVAKGLTNNIFDWVVPVVNSQECVFRLTGKTGKGSEVIIYSGQFSIGAAYCDIISPKSGDMICAGQVFEIKWKSDYVKNLYLQYSNDGGLAWKQIKFSPVAASEGSYFWTLPLKYSDNCLIKISQYESREIPLTISKDPFSIDSCATSVKAVSNIENNTLSINNLVPNPATDNLEIIFVNHRGLVNFVEVLLSDEKGSTINLGKFEGIKSGENKLNLKLPELAQGNYYLILKSGKRQTAKLLLIVD